MKRLKALKSVCFHEGEIIDVNKWFDEQEVVCTMWDEKQQVVEMYDGDPYYYVTAGWEIRSLPLDKRRRLDWDVPGTFATHKAAENYIKDRKPVYPSKMIDELIEWYEDTRCETVYCAKRPGAKINPEPIFDKLKQFRTGISYPKH